MIRRERGSVLCNVKPYEGAEPYLFFSYCHKNAAQVYPLIERMAADGYRIWYDDGIHPGDDWLKVIAEHLSGSAGCIACITPESTCSHNCKSEINLCLELGKPLLAIMLEDFPLTLATRLQLGAIQYVRKFQYARDSAFYEKLYSAEFLENCRGQRQPISIPLPPEEPPAPVEPGPLPKSGLLEKLEEQLAQLNASYESELLRQVENARQNAAAQLEAEKQSKLAELNTQLQKEQKDLLEARSRQIEETYAARLDAEKKAVLRRLAEQTQEKRSEQELRLRQAMDAQQTRKIQELERQLEEQHRSAVTSAQAEAEQGILLENGTLLEREKQLIEAEKQRRLADARKEAETHARRIWEEELEKLKQRVIQEQKVRIREAWQQIEQDAQEAWKRKQEEITGQARQEIDGKLAHRVEQLDRDRAAVREKAIQEILEACGLELRQKLRNQEEELAEETRNAEIAGIEQVTRQIENLRAQELSKVHNAAQDDLQSLWQQKSEEMILRLDNGREERLAQAAEAAEVQFRDTWNQKKIALESQIAELRAALGPEKGDDDVTVIVGKDDIEPPKKESGSLLVYPAGGVFYRLEATETKIGRAAASCDIVFPEDSGMSRHHATVICYRDKVYCKDEGAGNGTYINGVQLEAGARVLLESDTWIRMHNVELIYLSGREAERLLETRRLSLLREAGKHTHILLDREDLTLGRSREPQRGCFQDGKISRRHAVLSNRESGMYISDISRNGTYVNDVRLRSQMETLLADGAVLRMGDTVLECWNRQLTEGGEEV